MFYDSIIVVVSCNKAAQQEFTEIQSPILQSRLKSGWEIDKVHQITSSGGSGTLNFAVLTFVLTHSDPGGEWFSET